jgi:hypothetical protein
MLKIGNNVDTLYVYYDIGSIHKNMKKNGMKKE